MKGSLRIVSDYVRFSQFLFIYYLRKIKSTFRIADLQLTGGVLK